MDVDAIIKDIEKAKEQHSQEVERKMRDRIRDGAKETLDYYSRKLCQGYTPKEILKDLDKSKYK